MRHFQKLNYQKRFPVVKNVKVLSVHGLEQLVFTEFDAVISIGGLLSTYLDNYEEIRRRQNRTEN